MFSIFWAWRKRLYRSMQPARGAPSPPGWPWQWWARCRRCSCASARLVSGGWAGRRLGGAYVSAVSRRFWLGISTPATRAARTASLPRPWTEGSETAARSACEREQGQVLAVSTPSSAAHSNLPPARWARRSHSPGATRTRLRGGDRRRRGDKARPLLQPGGAAGGCQPCGAGRACRHPSRLSQACGCGRVAFCRGSGVMTSSRADEPLDAPPVSL